MIKLFKNYRLTKNIELLFLLIFGILLQITDGSPFTMQERWKMVWDTELPEEHFSQVVQKCIKMVLSAIVVVRCVTTYAYVVFAMLAIFCLLKNSTPKLLLPWLVISGIKSICMTFVEALTGVYVCSAFGKIRKACIEFFISKALEIIFAAYLWGSLLNVYQEMARKSEEDKKSDSWEQLFAQRTDFRHQRARSMVDESTLYKTACLNYFEFKDVPQIILQMLRRDDQMSQDSLLGPGMMLASVSNLGSLDTLKTSQSLGELGFVDLRSTQVVGLEEEGENLSPQEKALRFLKLTWSDVRKAQEDKWKVESDIYKIDQDTWNRLTATGARINKPKQHRAQVFWREIPQFDSSEDNIQKKGRKKALDVKFGLSLFSVFQARDSDSEEELDQNEEKKSNSFNEEEEEEEELDSIYDVEGDKEETPYFMSNIKEEVVVNRIRLDLKYKRMKGNTYAKLYQQEYMSAIGPEVFDRACKLPKVTSLTKITRSSEAKATASVPALMGGPSKSPRKINFDDDTPSRPDSCTDNIAIPQDRDPAVLNELRDKEEYKKEQICKTNSKTEENNEKDRKPENFSNKNDENQNCPQNESSTPCYRKRRIRIKRIGKPLRVTSMDNLSTDAENLSNDSDSCFDFTSTCEREETYSHQDSYSSKSDHSCESISEKDSKWRTNIKHVYFLTELLQKPLIDVLITYYDLRNRVHVRRRSRNAFLRQEKGLRSNQLNKYEGFSLYSPNISRRETKVWKSRVLKTAANYHGLTHEGKPKYFNNVATIVEREIAMRRFLKGVHSFLTAKRKKLSPQTTIIQRDQPERSVLGLELEDHFIPLLTLDVNESEWLMNDGQNSEVVLTQHLAENNLSNSSDLSALMEKFDSSSTAASGENTEEAIVRNSESALKILAENEHIDFICRKMSKIKASDGDSSNMEILKSCTDLEGLKDAEGQETPSEAVSHSPVENSPSGQESDEFISLYYSKAADLASPLLDMKRFIYPDHIHYSYKHVKKKGFDVDLNGGLPLLVRESLTMDTPVGVKQVPASKNSQTTITRRPMDLSFAKSNAFAEWQNKDQIDTDSITSVTGKPKISQKTGRNSITKKERKSSSGGKKGKKISMSKKSANLDENYPSGRNDSLKAKPKSYSRNFNDIKHLYSAQDHVLIKKLLRMHLQQNSQESPKSNSPEEEDRTPIQISSTQLHSNKGRINSTYNPAIFLQENRTRHEKKVETQEERTKDMFARLEREALFQSKNVQKSFAPSRRS